MSVFILNSVVHYFIHVSQNRHNSLSASISMDFIYLRDDVVTGQLKRCNLKNKQSLKTNRIYISHKKETGLYQINS